jgi:segregation and condensation protein A
MSADHLSPYDLLLALLSKEQQSISDVALSTITEQFLNYIDKLEEEAPEEVADFLTVAARLLLVKSSLLLPTFQLVEEDDLSLIDRLKLYEQFRDAALILQEAWDSDRKLYGHREAFVPKERFAWADGITQEVLAGAMQRLIDRNKPPKPLPQTQIDKTVSLKATIARLRSVFLPGTKTSFWKHAEKGSKTSIIVHFLALLELSKLGTVAPSQVSHFSDITIDVPDTV